VSGAPRSLGGSAVYASLKSIVASQ